MICPSCGSEHDAIHREQCFRCHIKGVTFGFRGSAMHGRAGWNRTANEWKQENLGTTDDKELARRGIERAS